MKLPILSTLALLSSPAFAVVNIDYVSVGHAGNVADPSDGDSGTAGGRNFFLNHEANRTTKQSRETWRAY